MKLSHQDSGFCDNSSFGSPFASSCLRGSALRSARRGFTFTEILFSVLILGIGFILIAGIFPVALKQTQTTAEETAAATIAKGGVSYLVKYSSPANSQSNWYTASGAADNLVHAIGPVTTPTDGVLQTNTLLWPYVSGNYILPSDSRYAWIPMYRQGLNTTAATPTPLPYIQVIVIGVQARNRAFYDASDLATRANNMTTLEARPLSAKFTGGTTETVQLTDINGNIGCAIDGAFLVVSNDTSAGTNGYIYRLGNLITAASGSPATATFGLAPGNDLTNATAVPGNGAAVTVLIVGAGYTDSSPATSTYYGPCQDVAAYSTFIPVH